MIDDEKEFPGDDDERDPSDELDTGLPPDNSPADPMPDVEDSEDRDMTEGLDTGLEPNDDPNPEADAVGADDTFSDENDMD